MYIYVYIYTYIYMHCMGAPHVVTFLLISHAGHPGIAGQSAHVEQGLLVGTCGAPREGFFDTRCDMYIYYAYAIWVKYGPVLAAEKNQLSGNPDKRCSSPQGPKQVSFCPDVVNFNRVAYEPRMLCAFVCIHVHTYAYMCLSVSLLVCGRGWKMWWTCAWRLGTGFVYAWVSRVGCGCCRREEGRDADGFTTVAAG